MGIQPGVLFESPRDFHFLKLEVLVKSFEPLLLQVDFGLRPGVTEFFILLKFVLVQVGVLGNGAEEFEGIVLLGCQVDHSLLL